VALAVLAAVSLVISVVLTDRSPAFAFFATPTRVWEFGLGGLVALTPMPSRFVASQPVQRLMSWLGLALVAVSMLTISKDLPFPGAIALLPAVGTALVLRSITTATRWSPTWIASWRPIQWIGDNSYSIYLWHWPLIIALPWLLKEPLTLPAKLGILAVTLALAAATKRFVEDPIRTRRSWAIRRRPNYVFVVVAMVATVTFAATATLALQAADRTVASAYERTASVDPSCFGASALLDVAHCDDPFARPTQQQLAFAASDLGPSQHCQMGTSVTTLTLCSFGDTTDPVRTVVVVGNSHALRLVPALEQYGAARHWKIVLAAKTDCMGLSATPVGAQSPTDTCVVWSGKVQRWILSTRPDAVVYASHVGAQVYLAGTTADAAAVDAARRNVVAAWTADVRAGIPVVVAGDVPAMRPQSDPECIARSTAAEDPCAMPRSAVVKPNLMTELADLHPDLVASVPLTSLFCDSSLCHGVIGGVVVYSDSHHLTDTYSRSIAEYFGSRVERAMTP
jgi:hypothetical protein